MRKIDKIWEVNVYARVAWIGSICHGKQRRKTDEAYIEHPLGVSCMIPVEYNTLAAKCAAVLHDVLEDVPEMIKLAMSEARLYFAEEFEIAERHRNPLLHYLKDAMEEAQYDLTTLLMWANPRGGVTWATEVVGYVRELTVEFPHVKYNSEDTTEYYANKQNEINSISDMSKGAAAVKGADKRYNASKPIPGRDWNEALVRYYQIAAKAVALRLSRRD